MSVVTNVQQVRHRAARRARGAAVASMNERSVRLNRAVLMAMSGAAALALAACGGDKGAETGVETTAAETAATAPAADAPEPTGQAGQIRIVGSSTVYPFTTAVAEQFRERYDQFASPIVESTGTGSGIKLFCEGTGPRTPDVVNASRRIKASEVELCRANGVTNIVEVQVGIDGLALAQSRQAGALNLTTRDVYAALAAQPFGRPQTARLWRDVNPRLPAEPIEVMGPPPTSGTRDSFNELIIAKGCETDPAMLALKSSDEDRYKEVCTSLREDGRFVESGENDNLIVQKLAANPRAVGVFGYSYIEENLDKLKAVPLGGVTPNYQTIASFEYPGARAMFIYVKGDRVDSKPGLREFVRAYASDAATGPQGYLTKRGLIASPPDVRARVTQVAQNLTPLDSAGLE